MALIACPECKRLISETVSSCPNCGYQLTPEIISKIKEESLKIQKGRYDVKPWHIVVMVIVAIVAAIGSFSETPDVGEDLSYDTDLVWSLSQDVIKKFLKSPATADFGKGGLWPEQNPDTNVTSIGDDIFLVKGWVDSQNSFGAVARTHFSLKMKCDGKTWKLLGVPVMEENY